LVSNLLVSSGPPAAAFLQSSMVCLCFAKAISLSSLQGLAIRWDPGAGSYRQVVDGGRLSAVGAGPSYGVWAADCWPVGCGIAGCGTADGTYGSGIDMVI
jgi:hypothetical protein